MKHLSGYALIRRHLRRYPPSMRQHLLQVLNQLVTCEPVIGIMGKTGVGKSSLCNALFRSEVCAVNAVEACTRQPQRVRLRFGTHFLTLVDLPGVGESVTRDGEYRELYRLAVEGMRDLASTHPDLRFVIEYKPREPRTHMFWSSAPKTILGIQQMKVDNVGVLLDFGHALFGGEPPAEAAQMLIDHDLLWGMDVNDNYRGWDDDMMVGSIHLVEIFEYFHVLKVNGWEGVWNLDQFPFREDAVANAKLSIRFLKAIWRALGTLDEDALAAAQARQDALGAQKVVQEALLSSMGA